MIVFDIDGTLSIVGDRLKYLQQEKIDWDSFYEACNEDEPNIPIVDLCRDLMIFKRVIYLTGRRESVRSKTIDWLTKYGLWEYNSSELYMRKDGDYRHDTIVKPELLVNGNIGNIEYIFEDRNSMVKKWRELGFTCLHVADGDF